MTPEALHDALNLLEEDLILPVEKLRRRKAFRWKPIGALAACLAVVCALGVFGHGAVRSGGRAESAKAELMAESAQEDSLTDTDAMSGRKETLPQATAPGVDTAEGVIMYVVQVEVAELTADGFAATVLGGGRGFAPGDTITVQFTEHTRFIQGKDTYSLPSEASFFCEGARVSVAYGTGQRAFTVIAETIYPIE